MIGFIKKLFVKKRSLRRRYDAPDEAYKWLKQHQFDCLDVHKAVDALSKEELEKGKQLLSQAPKTVYFGREVKDYKRVLDWAIFAWEVEHHSEVKKRIDWDKVDIEKSLVLKNSLNEGTSWIEIQEGDQKVVRTRPDVFVFTLSFAYEDCQYFLALLILMRKNGAWCFSNDDGQDVPLVTKVELLPLPDDAKKQVQNYVGNEKNAPMPKALIRIMAHNYLVQNNLM